MKKWVRLNYFKVDGSDLDILDYDTGGGEFLLSLGHPFERTSATEGYGPNVKLCRETLLPLGIHFKECTDPSKVPYEDKTFDIIINRHGDFDARECFRLLKKAEFLLPNRLAAIMTGIWQNGCCPEHKSPSRI